MKALEAPDIGHVVRETPDKIVVFGGGDERYDIPISEVQQVGANVLIGLKMYDIVTKYKVDRKEPLPTSRKDPWNSPDINIDLGTYEFISLRGKGSCFDLNERIPSGISAPTQNLLARLPAMASDKGNFKKSFNVFFRGTFVYFQGTFLSFHVKIGLFV